jgi:hypothetical protein
MVIRMGGKGSGRPRKYKDQFHRVMREKQRKYDLEIRAVMNELGCDKTEARKVRMKRKKEE